MQFFSVSGFSVFTATIQIWHGPEKTYSLFQG
jgi:hypothetical protein